MTKKQSDQKPVLEPRRSFVPKRVRNIVISAGILGIILVATGVVYTKITDSYNAPVLTGVSQPSAQVNPVNPPKISPKAPEGVAIDMLTSPVAQGDQASISITTNAGSQCKIMVAYNEKQVPAVAAGLTPQTADAYGSAEWTWTVDKTAPVGTWPVKVSCTYHGRAGVVIADLQVTQ